MSPRGILWSPGTMQPPSAGRGRLDLATALAIALADITVISSYLSGAVKGPMTMRATGTQQ